jgi:hypothetical protein
LRFHTGREVERMARHRRSRQKRIINTSVPVEKGHRAKLRVIAELRGVTEKQVVQDWINRSYPQYRRALAEMEDDSATKSR